MGNLIRAKKKNKSVLSMAWNHSFGELNGRGWGMVLLTTLTGRISKIGPCHCVLGLFAFDMIRSFSFFAAAGVWGLVF